MLPLLCLAYDGLWFVWRHLLLDPLRPPISRNAGCSSIQFKRERRRERRLGGVHSVSRGVACCSVLIHAAPLKLLIKEDGAAPCRVRRFKENEDKGADED